VVLPTKTVPVMVVTLHPGVASRPTTVQMTCLQPVFCLHQ